MSQSASSKTLRIFLKDTRHLWLEILISFAIVAGYTATKPYTWPLHRFDLNYRWAFSLSNWMAGLLPLSWWFLIARATHDESLIGDRQFWVTRPYGWKRVFAAKALFLVAYILLPYLVSDICQLHLAGLHVVRAIPGLLIGVATVAGFLLLPVFALAVITSGIGRMILAILGVVVYALFFSYMMLFSNTGTTHRLLRPEASWFPHTEHPLLLVSLLVLPIICLAVVLIQYSQRRTQLCIGMLLAMVFFFSCVAWTMQRTQWTWKPYPVLAAGDQPSIQFFLTPPESSSPPATSDTAYTVNAHLRFTVSGLASGHMVFLTASQSTLYLQGQEHLSKTWDRQDGPRLFSNDAEDERFQFSLAELHRNPGAVWSLHMEYALEEYEPIYVTTLHTAHEMDLPQNGHCVAYPSTGYAARFENNEDGYACVYAVHLPELSKIQYTLRKTCGMSSPDDLPVNIWHGASGSNLDSINEGVVVPIYESFSTVNYLEIRHPNLSCEGDTMTVTRYHFVRRLIVPVDVPAFDPSLYINR